MATIAFTSFLPEVVSQANGCSDLVALNAVRNSAIEFCERTLYWQELQDVTEVTSADFPYVLEAPPGAKVAQVLTVAVNGIDITPVSVDSLALISNWQSLAASQPSAYYQLSPYEMGVYPQLDDSTASLQLRVAYAPTRASTGIEEYVFQAYLEAIASGALYRLMEMPGCAWSNPELGMFHRSKFQQAVQDATVDANKTFGRAQMSVQMRCFA